MDENEIAELEKITNSSDELGATLSSRDHSQSTLALFEACEQGSANEVRRILTEGRVDLNALITGHRVARTALHVAASYGRTLVVKLLLKAGADPDKSSSIHRTSLHEACMGGHDQTLQELVKYSKDIDASDSYGQTAAHFAAYHGETACSKILIANNCDMNCQDHQLCTPAHLAAKQNYPETLQCLLDTNNVNILKTDKQGRTAVHYAALNNSISCLKVFKKCKVDIKITDKNGATSAHHAAAAGHLDCLKFLIKLDISLDGKDNLRKTCAHYAAQKGSTECLHWLLEQGADASSTDDASNTPAHSAATGHMQAMNCLIMHGTDLTVTNKQGDTPDMLSRKHGHTLAYKKAVKGEIKCPFCVKQKAQQEYDQKHALSDVEKCIKLEEKVIFKSPVKHRLALKNHQKEQSKQQACEVKSANSKRDISSQYYGEHLFNIDTK